MVAGCAGENTCGTFTCGIHVSSHDFSACMRVCQVQTATTDPPLGLPPGRWSFQMAACGTGALMATGSTGYRVCTDDTWTWNPAPIKSAWGPSHDQNGSWTMQAPATKPGHLGGAAMATITNLNNVFPTVSSDSGVLLFGGIFFGVGNTNIGPFSNDTWVWPATNCPSH